jgi:hypothetical protein
MKPTPAKPRIIIAQVEGSGTPDVTEMVNDSSVGKSRMRFSVFSSVKEIIGKPAVSFGREDPAVSRIASESVAPWALSSGFCAVLVSASRRCFYRCRFMRDAS